jgi:hypothetical protein
VKRDAVDACLTKTFRDVAVPEGLAERLLAGVAVGRADIPVCREGRGVLGRQECLPHRHESRSRRSRRWLVLGGGLVTAAATVLLAVWLGGPNAPCVSEESARDEAIRLFDTAVGQPGNLLVGGNGPTAYPYSSYVQSLGGTKWRNVNNFLGQYSGVVYDLPGPAGARAALYVVACDDAGGLGQQPASAQSVITTAGSRCCASAWQEGGLLYVLVVEGGQSTYERYLNLPSSPVV